MTSYKTFILVLFISLSFCSLSSAELLSSAALSTAETFVTTIDNGDYTTAYAQASSSLKIQTEPQQWIKEQKVVIQLLGHVNHRKLMSIRARDSYPGLPDGNYLLVCYQAQTEHKDKAVEVLLLQEQGGQWQVCRYTIK